jgi:small-conductance mechanosensitive channel
VVTTPLGIAAAAPTTPTSTTIPSLTPSPSGYIAELLRVFGVNGSSAQHVQDLVLPLVTMALILAVAAVLARYGGRMIRKGMNAAAKARSHARGEERPTRRVDTVGHIVANIWRVVVWTTASLVVLSKLGIDLAPFLFGATVIGMTIGFGAQTVVKDFLAGFLLLLEDQYRIGDTITAAGMTGVVDDVSLRVTRLRGGDGSVWYVPNGDIRELANMSRRSSTTSIDIVLPLGVNFDAATSAISGGLKVVAGDPAFESRFLEPPGVVGVTAIDKDGYTLTISIKTPPLEGAEVAREIRSQVTKSLDHAGVWATK